jgi:hypothetical protein
VNRSRTIFVFAFLFSYVFLGTDTAWAWGAGIHIAQGAFVLEHLPLLMSPVRDLLQAYPIDFLYGCISADIFIGKGSRRRDDHCHNWSIGNKMLATARAPFEQAFTYGYLSHLAADTVAHNFYIPNQLYMTSTTRKFGHLYWEYRSDSFTEKKYWKLARDVINSHDPGSDTFIKETVPSRVLSFRTKKRIYSTTIRMYDLEKWQQTVNLISQNSRWEVTREYITFLKKLSFCLTLDFLKNSETALCLKYDPVGSDNIRAAKKRRRLAKRLNGQKPDEIGFAIPSDLVGIIDTMETLGISLRKEKNYEV